MLFSPVCDCRIDYARLTKFLFYFIIITRDKHMLGWWNFWYLKWLSCRKWRSHEGLWKSYACDSTLVSLVELGSCMFPSYWFGQYWKNYFRRTVHSPHVLPETPRIQWIPLEFGLLDGLAGTSPSPPCSEVARHPRGLQRRKHHCGSEQLLSCPLPAVGGCLLIANLSLRGKPTFLENCISTTFFYTSSQSTKLPNRE